MISTYGILGILILMWCSGIFFGVQLGRYLTRQEMIRKLTIFQEGIPEVVTLRSYQELAEKVEQYESDGGAAWNKEQVAARKAVQEEYEEQVDGRKRLRERADYYAEKAHREEDH